MCYLLRIQQCPVNTTSNTIMGVLRGTDPRGQREHLSPSGSKSGLDGLLGGSLYDLFKGLCRKTTSDTYAFNKNKNWQQQFKNCYKFWENPRTEVFDDWSRRYSWKTFQSNVVQWAKYDAEVRFQTVSRSVFRFQTVTGNGLHVEVELYWSFELDVWQTKVQVWSQIELYVWTGLE